MGTTLSGILISSVGKVIINIGDSRVYGINENKEFLQLSEDHTLVNDMLKHHEITYEQALNHPKKNVLTNAMGVWNSVKIDLIPYPEVLNSILICSDGLHGYVAKEVKYRGKNHGNAWRIKPYAKTELFGEMEKVRM